MHFRRRVACLLLLIAACAAWPASAQIRRCVTATGEYAYTDRQCHEIGATERVQPQSPTAPGARIIRRDCSRNLQDLVFELGAAIDSRDVNRLAGIYHWPGTSARSAGAIMDRLDTIANRPLVDISPLQPPEPVAAVEPPPSPLAWRSSGSGMGSGESPSEAAPQVDPDAELPAEVQAAVNRQSRARRTPTGLIVDQTIANRITPARTVFSLRRHLDCWWISL